MLADDESTLLREWLARADKITERFTDADGNAVSAVFYDLGDTLLPYRGDDSLFEDAILLDKEPLWPEGTVPYVINVGEAHGAIVRQAMDAWEQGTPFRFRPRGGEKSYVQLSTSAPPDGRNSSSIGRRGGAQNVTIRTDMFTVPTLCHELGHVLGLWHEHQRPDRDTYVTYHAENVRPAYNKRMNYEKVPAGQAIGAYDFHSIMHYTPAQGGIPPEWRPIFVCKPGYERYQSVIGRQAGPSQDDRKNLADLYRARGLLR